MEQLSEKDRIFIVTTVGEVLAATAPEEVDIYAVSSEDILRHATARTTPEADSDAFFGGLEHTLGEILTHALALVAVEFLKHGWTLSREALVAYLKGRAANSSQEPSKLVEAEATILAVLAPQAAGAEETPLRAAATDTVAEEASDSQPLP